MKDAIPINEIADNGKNKAFSSTEARANSVTIPNNHLYGDI